MYSEEQIATARSQARNLRDQACKGGLRFEAYLPPKLANWALIWSRGEATVTGRVNVVGLVFRSTPPRGRRP